MRAASDEDGAEVVYMSEPLDRPQSAGGPYLQAEVARFSEHAIYLTINDIIIGGHRRPFEVFINSKNMEHYAWTLALTRMISAVFRRGGDVSFVVEELKAVFDPRGGAWVQGKYIPSILAAIGGVIETHHGQDRLPGGRGHGIEVRSAGGGGEPRTRRAAKPAPACGQYEMQMVEGCMTCRSCGHSKCG